MKTTLAALVIMVMMLTGCQTTNTNNLDNFDAPKPRGILGTVNPNTQAAVATTAFDNNATSPDWTKPNTNNMKLVENQQGLTKTASTQIASGPGFSSVTKTATASGFSHQVWKGASHSTHFSAF